MRWGLEQGALLFLEGGGVAAAGRGREVVLALEVLRDAVVRERRAARVRVDLHTAPDDVAGGTDGPRVLFQLHVPGDGGAGEGDRTAEGELHTGVIRTSFAEVSVTVPAATDAATDFSGIYLPSLT